MLSLSEREIEIEKLRELSNLTFKEIGLRYHVSASRASSIYRQIRRKRNEQRKRELYLEQNTHPVSVCLTIGDIAQLQRILANYRQLRETRIRANSLEYECLQSDIDYINAGKFQDKFMELERTERSKKKQDANVVGSL